VKRIFAGLNAVLAISAGIIVLLGYFIDSMSGFRFFLFQWAVILAGVAVLVGIGNLFSVHLQKIRERRPGSIYSLVLLVFMLITIIAGLTPSLLPFQTMLLDGIMLPAEISLIAVLSITLIYSGIRLLRVRGDLTSILFLSTALIILLGIGPLPYLGQLPIVSDWLRPFISYALATGGARGILIGVALGTLTTGLRILVGIDRPYGGK
jgi:hypothetical protein